MRTILGISLTLLVIVFASPAPAQTQIHFWSQRFGGTGTDTGKAVAVDAAGNVVVAGSFNGTVNFGGGNLVSVGGFDMFLAKYNANGVNQWSQRPGARINRVTTSCFSLKFGASVQIPWLIPGRRLALPCPMK
jgi:hypothetical protein